jgi:glycerol-3-phosphate dehydrogenase
LISVIERRNRLIRSCADRRFDAAIIGGGINGAAIAYAAARSGLSVALFEKGDFASGTSSRSSRLIHGGIRYLEYGHLGMVFESSRERRTLSAIAPHLVRPLAFTWPVYRGARIPRWKLRAGLLAYDLLSRYGNFAGHQSLAMEQVLESEPALSRKNLLGGARYYDAATDDSRLTLANVRAAVSRGALALNHCVLRGITSEGKETILNLSDVHRADGETVEFSCSARLVVNATGPWTDDVIRLVRSGGEPVVRGSKGVHIAVPRERVGNRAAITIVSPDDGRVLFVLPSVATAIIGTTETHNDETPDEVRAKPADVEYLLSAVNQHFPDAQLAPSDVVAAWAGIRPLAAAHVQGEPGRASREHALTWDDNVLTVTGGKLTTYRVVANDVVGQLRGRLGRTDGSEPQAETLPGSSIVSFDDEAEKARQAVDNADTARLLVSSYGSQWREVWRLAEDSQALAHRIDPALPWLRAEVLHAVRVEMALTVSDVLMRRTHLAFELRDHGRAAASGVAELMAAELDWTESETAGAVNAYDNEASRIFGSSGVTRPA